MVLPVDSAGRCLAVYTFLGIWKEDTPFSGEKLSPVLSMWTVSGVKVQMGPFAYKLHGLTEAVHLSEPQLPPM